MGQCQQLPNNMDQNQYENSAPVIQREKDETTYIVLA